MNKQTNMRVGAILDGDKERVRLLGYGVYEGDFVPPKEVNPGLNMGIPNPKIRLDDGNIVWGCECWWGPEEEIRKSIGNRRIELVDIEAFRASN